MVATWDAMEGTSSSFQSSLLSSSVLPLLIPSASRTIPAQTIPNLSDPEMSRLLSREMVIKWILVRHSSATRPVLGSKICLGYVYIINSALYSKLPGAVAIGQSQISFALSDFFFSRRVTSLHDKPLSFIGAWRLSISPSREPFRGDN